MIRTLSILALASVVSCSAFAQDAMHYREGQRVDPTDVARILGASRQATKTRSIRLLDGASASKEAAGPTSLSLPVRFAFASSDVAPSARPQLDALATGIKLLPADQSVVIEGHTDATGTDEYNLKLSQRRAAAVKQYLVQTHGIDEHRLLDTGVGKQQPIAGTDPYASENRRVQFRGS